MKNPAAVALGSRNKGIKKKISPERKAQLLAQMKLARESRWLDKQFPVSVFPLKS